MKQSAGLTLLGWLVTLVLPFVFLFTSVRLLLTPAFVNIEYRMPGFPEDAYGMTMEQRLRYTPIMLEYLLNDQGPAFLADQTFDDGNPLLNEREVGHMEDVKELTRIVLNVWMLLLALLVGAGAAAWYFSFFPQFRAWLVRGAQLTIGLIITILIFVALSFNALFTAFHRIFFEGDTWLFQYSDTLIRLFPIRFWQDVFIALGALTLLGAGLIWWVFTRLKIKDRE
ncbi:MAG: TIGR01906 family membrane protein [Chloroflexi bacterium]|nr:TIGR01906 family membrane protein [Chloroflexota bacterium]